MELQAWVAVAVGVMAILSGVYAAVRFIVRSIMAEIGPKANGSSLKEQVHSLSVIAEGSGSRNTYTCNSKLEA
jgi:hypothetical protein